MASPSGSKPLQRELSRMVTKYPDVNKILDKMYTNIEDPHYNGDPAEELHKAERLLEWHKICEEFDDFRARQLEDTVNVENKSIEWLTEPYTVSIYPRSEDGSAAELVVPQPTSDVLREAEGPLGKPLESIEEEAAEQSKKKFENEVERDLRSRRRKVDPKPTRLGPNGTWVNDSDGGEGDRTQTSTQRGSTITLLQRQDTLTD